MKKEIKERNEAIYLEWMNTGRSQLVLAIKYNITEDSVSRILTNELKKRKRPL